MAQNFLFNIKIAQSMTMNLAHDPIKKVQAFIVTRRSHPQFAIEILGTNPDNHLKKIHSHPDFFNIVTTRL